MGVVAVQSIKNLIFTYIGFAIGALNTLFLYQRFMSSEYFGLVNVVLSASMILYPILSFGMGSAMIRFYSINLNKNEKGEFLSFALFSPIVVIAVLGVLYYSFIPQINSLLSDKSILIKEYIFYIFFFAVFMGYFEVFYAYSKVQLKTVFGNILKEIFIRVIVTSLLILLYFDKISEHEFVQYLLLSYGLRVLIMAWYSLKNTYRELIWKIPSNANSIIKYVLFVVISSSITFLFLEIDKVMVSQFIDLSNVAYYAVATFIGIVVAVPGRAMQQILSPLVAKASANNDLEKVFELYKKSSINLLVVSGYIFLLITLNTTSLFQMFDDKFKGGETVVLYIALAKLISMSIGSNNAIISNSRYYRYDLLFGVLIIGISISLNVILIPILGIDGAALATLITVATYNLIKFSFVYYKFKMQPFTAQTTFVLVFLIVSYFSFIWIPLYFHPFIQIILTSVLLSIVFLLFIMIVKPSADINNFIKNIISRNKL